MSLAAISAIPDQTLARKRPILNNKRILPTSEMGFYRALYF